MRPLEELRFLLMRSVASPYKEVYLETATLMLRIAEQQLRSWQQREQWWRGRHAAVITPD